jgi:hypothetical protein
LTETEIRESETTEDFQIDDDNEVTTLKQGPEIQPAIEPIRIEDENDQIGSNNLETTPPVLGRGCRTRKLNRKYFNEDLINVATNKVDHSKIPSFYHITTAEKNQFESEDKWI